MATYRFENLGREAVMKRLLMLVMSIVLCSAAMAAEDSMQARRVAAERYVRAANMEKMVEETLVQLMQQVPAGEREKFRAELKGVLTVQAMERISIEAAVKTFTVDELNALADFYSSKHGASVMAKMGTYLGYAMPLMQQEILRGIERQKSRSR